MNEEFREQIALFRYGVIGELVSRPLGPREKERLLERIATQTWDIPGCGRRRIGRSTNVGRAPPSRRAAYARLTSRP